MGSGLLHGSVTAMPNDLIAIATAAAANSSAAKSLFQKRWAIRGQDGSLRASGKHRFIARDGAWQTECDFSFVGHILVQCQGSVSLRHRLIDKIIHTALSEKWPESRLSHPIALIPVKVPVFDISDAGLPELGELVDARAALWRSLAHAAHAAQATLQPLTESRENYLDYLQRKDAWVFVYDHAVRFLMILGKDPDAAWRRAADRGADSGVNAAFFDWCERNRATVMAAAEKIYA